MTDYAEQIRLDQVAALLTIKRVAESLPAPEGMTMPEQTMSDDAQQIIGKAIKYAVLMGYAGVNPLREAEKAIAALAEVGLAIVDKADLETVTDAMGATAHVLTDMQEWAEAMVARDRLIAVAWPESATADYLRIAGSHPDQLAARQPEGDDGE